MKITHALAPLLITLPLTAHAFAQNPVQPFSAEYVGYFKGVPVASATRKLVQKENGSYQLTSDATVLGVGITYKDVSHFSFNEQQFHSDKFTHKHRSLFVKEKVTGKSDQNGGLVVKYKGKKIKAPATELGNMLDPGAFSVKLQTDIKQQNPTLDYQFIYADEIEKYHFERIGEESIKTPLGEFQTIKLRQQNNEKRQTYLWFAPELDYQLVRMEIVRKGKRWANLELTKLNFAQTTAQQN